MQEIYTAVETVHVAPTGIDYLRILSTGFLGMAVLHRISDEGYFLCHRTWIEETYSKLGMEPVDIFEIATPFRMDAEAERIAKEMEDEYPDAVEEIDPYLPEPLVEEISINTFVDADFAHDTATRRSITGLITLVGSTPVVCKSKRQGAVATSTYDSEFSAMRSAVEETMAIRYSLRSLGVKVQQASNVMCDNLGVVQGALRADT